jgi:hypothetical protein
MVAVPLLAPLQVTLLKEVMALLSCVGWVIITEALDTQLAASFTVIE